LCMRVLVYARACICACLCARVLLCVRVLLRVDFVGYVCVGQNSFLNNANTQYVGDGGLAFFFCLLLVWCSISGYFLLRTGDIDLFVITENLSSGLLIMFY